MGKPTRVNIKHHTIDDKNRVRMPRPDFKNKEGNEKDCFVCLRSTQRVGGEELKYLEFWDASDLDAVMNSEVVGRKTAFEQSKLFASRRFCKMDSQGRVAIGDKLMEHIDNDREVVVVPILRTCDDYVVNGFAMWKRSDYVKHIDPTFTEKVRNGKA